MTSTRFGPWIPACAGMNGECAALSSNYLSHLLRAHIFTRDARYDDRLLHGVAAERLAKLLIEDHRNEGGDALLLRLAGLAKCLRQFRLRFHYYALEAARFGHLCIAEMRIEFGANEIVVVPEDRIALFRAPLVVAEDDHGDAGPFLAADRTHFVHGNAERAVTGKADAWRIGIADFGADDRRETVAAGSEQARRQVFPSFVERRIGVVAGDDCVLWQGRLNRAPGLPRRHAVGIALACVFIPCGAWIVILVIHA